MGEGAEGFRYGGAEFAGRAASGRGACEAEDVEAGAGGVPRVCDRGKRERGEDYGLQAGLPHYTNEGGAKQQGPRVNPLGKTGLEETI